MDEYARAAADLCRVLETVPAAKFTGDRKESPDPDCTTIQNMCIHVIGAAHGYANHLLRAQGKSIAGQPEIHAAQVAAPGAMAPLLAEAIRRTESILHEILKLPQAQQEALVVRPNWGMPMQIDLLLEHAIVHLLRHRRQVERW